MLDLRYVVEHLDEVAGALALRGESVSLDPIKSAADRRRELIGSIEAGRAELNAASKAMKSLPKGSEDFDAKRLALRSLGDRIKGEETELKTIESELAAQLLYLPNLPHESAPRGTSEADNPIVQVWGEPPAFDFEPKDHVSLGQALGLIDFERASKLSGARFVVLRGQASRLNRALIQWMLDTHAEQGYVEHALPAILGEAPLLGTGQLPKFAEEQLFELATQGDEMRRYLSPTAEVALTNLHADEIVPGDALPLRYTAYAPCFRREAGSYGRDTRGMIRQHQFDKVELVHFCRPEDGLSELERLRRNAERILEQLGLHYRTVELCTGDMGFAAQKCFDLEVWLPGQSAFREISSCSWCGDFQARRAKIRYKGSDMKKPRLVHTLNGSALAVGRTLVAIMEQYQEADGSVRVPEVLRPYLGGAERLTAAVAPG